MIFRLFRPDPRKTTLHALYGVIVAQARRPEFYTGYDVPDTVDGRFDMIVLHLALFLRRLRREPADFQPMGQGLFDVFCRDMDHNLREMGIGDLAVPKEMKRLGEAFYGRLEAYDRAFSSGSPDAVAAALARNVATSPAGARQLAAYALAAARLLDEQDAAAFARGEVAFPRPQHRSGRGDETSGASERQDDEPVSP
ncbi:MAG TPA: ubiquinol-cytochrome C chaperone family protein [Xanthobacteraceae bacterium]|nr:ubiquinol-cytochrome C chaperone family protein [Xanthobacteraceae bacterium]